MNWKVPPFVKIYEALGCLADGRLVIEGNSATCTSSSGGKTYTVTYDPQTKAIMANDNGSYWQGYLGYPAIAYLMDIGELPYDESMAAALKGIPWKDINTRFKNNYDKTTEHVERLAAEHGIPADKLMKFAGAVLESIKKGDYPHLGTKKMPPSGY